MNDSFINVLEHKNFVKSVHSISKSRQVFYHQTTCNYFQVALMKFTIKNNC